MAITAAALQTELGASWLNSPRVLRHLPSYAAGDTGQHWLVSGGTAYPGRVKMITTTKTDDAATQAAAVLLALLTGPTT